MLDISIMKEPRKPCVLPGKKKKLPILAEAFFVDTETSNNYDPETGDGDTWIYQWAGRWCREFTFGRDAVSLIETMERIASANGCDPEQLLAVCYIHNASYDLSYLIPFLQEKWGIRKILATAAHKMIVVESGPWIIRCSYRLSNRSLAKWGKDLHIEHQKKTGLIEYNVRRYPDTKLTRRDWIYQLYDVVALEECVLAEMRREHDTLQSIPLTSTGYIRRDGRKRAIEHKDRSDFQRTRMDVDVYKDFRFSFAGGLTHGNRFVIGETVYCVQYVHVGNKIRRLYGRHRDFRSMYPTELRRRYHFPIGPFIRYYDYEPGLRCTWEELDELKKENCLIITAIIRGCELKKGETLPYLQQSKCLLGSAGDYRANILDNGRVIKCSGATCLSLTDIDWDILRKQYDFTEEPQIVRVLTSKAGPVPKYLEELVDHYYHGKSAFKDKVKELKDAKADDALLQDAEISLMKSKNGINGIYGLSATDPVRLDWNLDTNTYEWSHSLLTDEVIEEKLDKFYASRNSYMRYQIGVYVTAHARKDLMDMYWLIGPKNFLYGDTDSIFYRSSPEIEERLEAENKRRYEAAIAEGGYIENNGKIVTYDSFDDEGENIRKFRFLHAKAYAYVTNDGELHCTVAGVSKRDKHGYTREKEMENINNLREGFVFKRCGGTTCAYVTHEPRWIKVDGHDILTGGGAILIPTFKTLHDETHGEQDIYFEPADDIIESQGGSLV